MLKQKRQLFELLFMASDLCVVSIAWVLAYWLRFRSGLVEVDKGVPQFTHYLSQLLFIWLIWAYMFKRAGLYRAMRGVRKMREVWLLIRANLFSSILLIAVTYLFREKDIPFSRLVFVYFGVLATILSTIQRSVLRFALREARRKGFNLRYMLVIGAEKTASDIVSRVRYHKDLGIQLVGCLSRDGDEKRGPGGVPVIGKYEDLAAILSKTDIDQVVVALPLCDGNYLPGMLEILRDSVVDVRVVPDVYQFISVGGSIEEFEGIPVIAVQESPISGIDLVAKRALDLVFAIFAIIFLLPLFFAIAVLIKLTSRGPVIYSQERVSFDGTRFKILKFRTMKIDAESSGPKWSTKDDGRVTWLGRFLRTYSLDELPQLFNVLRGDMSLVGPRPERPFFINEFRTRIPSYMLRHKVPAGMTGWAQINGWRGDTSIDKRIEYDLYYIQNWSIMFDIKIVLQTLLSGLREKRATDG